MQGQEINAWQSARPNNSNITCQIAQAHHSPAPHWRCDIAIIDAGKGTRTELLLDKGKDEGPYMTVMPMFENHPGTLQSAWMISETGSGMCLGSGGAALAREEFPAGMRGTMSGIADAALERLMRAHVA